MIEQYLPNYSVTYLLHIIISLFSIFGYIRLKKAYNEKKISSLKNFAMFFLLFGIFLFSMGLPMLIPVELSPVKLGGFFIFGHVLLYAALVYFIQVPFSLSFPKYRKYAVWFNIAMGTIITYTNLIYWNEPTIEGSITLMHVTGPVGPMIGVLNIINLLLFGTFYFGYMAIQNRGTERWKYSLLSLAFLLITVGGPLHDNATGLTQYLIADALIFLALATLFAGIYVKSILHPRSTKDR